MSLEALLIPALVFIAAFGALVALLWKSMRPRSGETSAGIALSAVPWAPAGAVGAALIASVLFLGTNESRRADRRIAEVQDKFHNVMKQGIRYRRFALGGLRDSVQRVGSMLDGKTPVDRPNLWRASIAYKAYLYETDAAATNYIVNRHHRVVQWDEESWLDGPKRLGVLRLLLRRTDESHEPIILNIDMGIEGRTEKDVGKQVQLRVGPPDGPLQIRAFDAKAVDRISAQTTKILDETLFLVDILPTKNDYGDCSVGSESDTGLCVVVEVVTSNEYSTSGSYSLYVPNISLYEDTIGSLNVRHHFSREPEEVAELGTYRKFGSMLIDHQPRALRSWTRDCKQAPVPDGVVLPGWWQFGSGVIYCASFNNLEVDNSWPVFAYRQVPSGKLQRRQP
jgi:hypothetical protein